MVKKMAVLVSTVGVQASKRLGKRKERLRMVLDMMKVPVDEFTKSINN